LRAQVDRAKALVGVAHFDEARRLLDALLVDRDSPSFHAIGGVSENSMWPDVTLLALEAQAQLLRGRVLAEQGAYANAEQVLFLALVRAQSARADEVVTVAAIDLAYVVGDRLSRFTDALRWADFAEASIAGAGGDETFVTWLLVIRATILADARRFEEAERAARTAVAMISHKAPGGVLHAQVVDVLNAVLFDEGKLDGLTQRPKTPDSLLNLLDHQPTTSLPNREPTRRGPDVAGSVEEVR
jgi:tetratricopeptide (TPR) repeat protein